MTERLELTPDSMKALAHPVRLSILRVLQLQSQASVTGLAQNLGESTATISYHLRKLAEHGFVEEFDDYREAAESIRPGRKQRWWRMAVADVHSTGYTTAADAATHRAEQFLLQASVSQRGQALQHWYATATRWPEKWQLASTAAEVVLRLDPTGSRALADELAALLDRYRSVPDSPEARAVEFHYAVFPADTEDIGPERP